MAGQGVPFTLPPGTTLFQLVLFSEPVVLASGTNGGTVNATIPATVTPGTHQVVLWAVVDGSPETFGAIVEVTLPTPTDVLPATGGSPWDMVRLAVGLCLFGAVACAVAVRRRGLVDRGAQS